MREAGRIQGKALGTGAGSAAAGLMASGTGSRMSQQRHCRGSQAGGCQQLSAPEPHFQWVGPGVPCQLLPEAPASQPR